MKIVYISSLNPFFGSSASANRLRTLLEGLSGLGTNVSILITEGFQSFGEFKKLGRKGRFSNINYHYLSFQFNGTLWQRRINKFILNPFLKHSLFNKIKGIATRSSQSVFWSGCELSLLEIIVELKRQNPSLKTFLEINEILDYQKFNKGRAIHMIEGEKRQSYFENKAYYSYDGIALMTRTLMKHYIQYPQPGPKLLHLPMTVDLDRFKNKDPLPGGFVKPYIAFIGTMNDAKDGINILIQAFAKIATTFNDYKLYLVGGWNYDTPTHQKLIKEFGLETRIFWMGEFQRDLIPSIIMNADLLVLPRPDSKQTQGGFPTKLGEYLATGNPVCATRVGEIPDYLTDGQSVYFAEPGSADSFAEAMGRALSNPVEARIIGLNGRKIAEKHFNKDIQAKILYDFIQSNILDQ